MNCILFYYQGMTFDFLLQTPEDLKKLNTIVDVTQELHYVMDAITLTRQRLEGKCPLIGFAGAPVRYLKKFVLFKISRELGITSSR